MLEPFRNKVEWRNSLQPFVGVHFSNELLDALPVRLINGGVEKLVDLQGDKFLFIERPLSSTEFNQAALDWVDSVAANLQRGYAITVDYGHSGNEFQGSVQVRAQHRHLDSPFEQIGHADITMQVDWTSIARRAEANGLRVAGLTDQHHFLTGIISTWPDLVHARSSAALQTLLHPEMLGRAFQVLALAKNVHGDGRRLGGLKFGRNLCAALEITR